MRVVRIFTALGALTIAAPPVGATTFTPGEFFTYDQFEYGTNTRLEEPNNPQAAALLEDNFDTVYAPFEDLLQVGVPGPAGYSLIFDSPDAVLAYLPTGGTPGPLTADLLDPLSSSSGVLGGEVVAATLNTDFSNAGLLAHPASVALGDLVFQNLETLVGTNFFFYPVDPEIADLDGLPVHEVLSEANLVLGGHPNPSGISAADFYAALFLADDAFHDGLLPTYDFADGAVLTPSSYLIAPDITPPAVPEPSTWAMMLLGFAGLGYAGYRQRQKLAGVASV
jgi:PEP-CTERM motif